MAGLKTAINSLLNHTGNDKGEIDKIRKDLEKYKEKVEELEQNEKDRNDENTTRRDTTANARHGGYGLEFNTSRK